MVHALASRTFLLDALVLPTPFEKGTGRRGADTVPVPRDTLVDAVENAEVAEIKRAVPRTSDCHV
eukprot:5514716-Amphidinium_carterae.3